MLVTVETKVGALKLKYVFTGKGGHFMVKPCGNALKVSEIGNTADYLKVLSDVMFKTIQLKKRNLKWRLK